MLHSQTRKHIKRLNHHKNIFYSKSHRKHDLFEGNILNITKFKLPKNNVQLHPKSPQYHPPSSGYLVLIRIMIPTELMVALQI